MEEINDCKELLVVGTKKDSITLELDSREFGDYKRQGQVENVKVAKKVSFHSWAQSFKNPVASSQYGMLETPDLAKFGRSDQLHVALCGITEFLAKHGRYPEPADQATCLDLAKALMEKNKADEGFFQEEVEEKVFNPAVNFASCSISPMAAFYGGIVAQEIVKYTGKYSPMK